MIVVVMITKFEVMRTVLRACDLRSLLLQETYGKDAMMWWVRWRLFYISCSEFFGAKNGTVSGVSHYLFKKR